MAPLALTKIEKRAIDIESVQVGQGKIIDNISLSVDLSLTVKMHQASVIGHLISAASVNDFHKKFTKRVLSERVGLPLFRESLFGKLCNFLLMLVVGTKLGKFGADLLFGVPRVLVVTGGRFFQYINVAVNARLVRSILIDAEGRSGEAKGSEGEESHCVVLVYY